VIAAIAAGAKKRLGRAVVSFSRWRFSQAHISGHGLEIGALHSPFKLPRSAHATYVDRLPASELRHHYPELDCEALVDVDVVDDAQTLATIPTSSQDFVIACHILEHCEDPIGAVYSWLRVVRPGGVVLLAVPDKRFTFDNLRPTTPLDHVLQDHLEGPTLTREDHYLEWVRLVERVPENQAESRARQLRESRYSIHFHVWDRNALSQLLEYCVNGTTASAKLSKLSRNRSENLALLVKTDA